VNFIFWAQVAVRDPEERRPPAATSKVLAFDIAAEVGLRTRRSHFPSRSVISLVILHLNYPWGGGGGGGGRRQNDSNVCAHAEEAGSGPPVDSAPSGSVSPCHLALCEAGLLVSHMAGGALSCIPLDDASGDMVQLAADIKVNRIPHSLFCTYGGPQSNIPGRRDQLTMTLTSAARSSLLPRRRSSARRGGRSRPSRWTLTRAAPPSTPTGRTPALPCHPPWDRRPWILIRGPHDRLAAGFLYNLKFTGLTQNMGQH
jgi:hypothetical protein